MGKTKKRRSGSDAVRRTFFDEDEAWGRLAPDVPAEELLRELHRRLDDALGCAEALVAREERMLLFRGKSDEEECDPAEPVIPERAGDRD